MEEENRPNFDELINITEEEYKEKYLLPQLAQLHLTYEEFCKIIDEGIDCLPF